MAKKKIKGKVVSDKMEKTVIVEVEIFKIHPMYRKKFRMHKRYKAHDPKNEFKVGDNVIIEEARPLSRDKRFKVIEKI